MRAQMAARVHMATAAVHCRKKSLGCFYLLFFLPDLIIAQLFDDFCGELVGEKYGNVFRGYTAENLQVRCAYACEAHYCCANHAKRAQ